VQSARGVDRCYAHPGVPRFFWDMTTTTFWRRRGSNSWDIPLTRRSTCQRAGSILFAYLGQPHRFCRYCQALPTCPKFHTACCTRLPSKKADLRTFAARHTCLDGGRQVARQRRSPRLRCAFFYTLYLPPPRCTWHLPLLTHAHTTHWPSRCLPAACRPHHAHHLHHPTSFATLLGRMYLL